MKTPDSRPRFQSATRHYHRYREENRDGWKEWVDGSKKSGKSRLRGASWKWLLAVGGAVGGAALLGVILIKLL